MSSNEAVDSTRIITGFRPTSDLTVGNYLGAIRPVLDIQNDPNNDLYVFVADLHGLTDHNPNEIAPFRKEVVHDCLALGVDATKATVYLQSDIELPVVSVANRVAPYVSIAELMRTPNLKEKMQTAVRKGQSSTEDALTANFGLLGYPLLMSADIYAQKAPGVAVGEDQEPHLELARTIARRFNRAFSTDILVEPKLFAVEAVRIVSLDGKGKMSKTNPNQAILLTDDPEEARLKIKKAATAQEGIWNEVIASHFLVAENTTQDPEKLDDIAQLKAAHMDGRAVMGAFKNIWGDITAALLEDFQQKRQSISGAQVDQVLEQGSKKASSNATDVLNAMQEVMGF